MAVGERTSSRSGSDALRFEPTHNVLVAAHDDIAILELEGTFHASAKRSAGRPRLVVTTADGSSEIKAVEAHTAHAGPKPSTWTAAFAVPRVLSDADDASFALAIGRSVVLDLPAPTRQEPAASKSQDELEGQTWGSMVVDLSEARRELEETQEELARAQEELDRLRTEAEQAPQPDEDEAPRPRVTWLEEVEAEAASTNGHGPASAHADEDDDLDDDDEATEDDAPSALPVLANRRTTPPPTFEHEVVYEATLKKVQVERRQRLRRRRILGRLLALIVFLLAAAVIYVIVEGGAGVDLLNIV